jgi:hypothetical protein
MDPTVLSSLMAIGGMILGFLIRHCLGGTTSSAPAAPSNPLASSVSAASQSVAATHPLITALTSQFDAAIQQLAANFANSTLTATSPTNAPTAPPK